MNIDSKLFVMIVEGKLQLSIDSKDDGKGKEIVPSPSSKDKGIEKETSTNKVDLEEDIVIPNWDLSTLFVEKMDILDKLCKKTLTNN